MRGRQSAGQSDSNNTENTVYGFIAQQIKSVIPDAVRIQTEFLPNIFLVADYNSVENIITLPSDNENLNIIAANAMVAQAATASTEATAATASTASTIAAKIKCYDMRDNTIIVEVVEIISARSFKINNIKYRDSKIFVYGTEVNDFHALNKEYINTLNVCAVQELHRKIISQQNKIKELNDKMNVLLSYIDLSRMNVIQDEINDLKARYDLIINFINLSK